MFTKSELNKEIHKSTPPPNFLRKKDNKEHANIKLNSILISIVIPLYNEEKTIKDVVEKIPYSYNQEIIVVDDGSTDNSREILKKTRRKIRLIQHEKNKGYGAAILTGISKSKGNIIVTIDSDGQHDPSDIPKMLEPLLKDQADIVIGSRYLGKCKYNVPLHTRVGEKSIETLLWLLFRQKISNNQSGFRAFNKKSIIVFENSFFENYGLCTQMLFEAGLRKLRIIEIPITLHPRFHGVSRVKLLEVIRSIIICIIIYTIKKIINLFFPSKLACERLNGAIQKFFNNI
ncbi:MAG: glycosyltransferase family 2 protein [Promethearchaeota archaeon]